MEDSLDDERRDDQVIRIPATTLLPWGTTMPLFKSERDSRGSMGPGASISNRSLTDARHEWGPGDPGEQPIEPRGW